jgi:hypothetical protein
VYPGVYGPITTPASRYPTIGDNLSLCVTIPSTHAAVNAAATSVISGTSCAASPEADARMRGHWASMGERS